MDGVSNSSVPASIPLMLFLKKKLSLCWSGIGLVFSGTALSAIALLVGSLADSLIGRMAKVWSLLLLAFGYFFEWLND
jgi:hypothetical protein